MRCHPQELVPAAAELAPEPFGEVAAGELAPEPLGEGGDWRTPAPSPEMAPCPESDSEIE